MKRIKLRNTRKMGAGSESKTFNRKKKNEFVVWAMGNETFSSNGYIQAQGWVVESPIKLTQDQREF